IGAWDSSKSSLNFCGIWQLFGGIQRYMEQFPDGGYFKGKNFVFDHRISVGSRDKDVLGTCLICHSPFDDYSSRCRCSYCRMLILVCDICQGNYRGRYICELCQKHFNDEKPMPLVLYNQLDWELPHESFDVIKTEAETLLNSSPNPYSDLSIRSVSDRSRKLRILCLHGFRQNASSFKGRTSSLAKKLKNITEFIFVDAPHELPFIYQPAELLSQQVSPAPSENCKRRFAWLVSPNSNSSDESSWRIEEQQFDPFQYKTQTEGFELSYSYLEGLILKNGPFDGILGFSQGAAMAALFFEKQQRSGGVSDLRFAFLCSGFSTVSSKSVPVNGFIKLPSLHVFGDGGKDRQINVEASRELAELFDKNSSVIVEHDMGHIIPTRSPYIDQIKAFLMSFQ
ncbi:rhodanese-like domain-containing protein 6, partial [Phalaenopsis equestris]|uniref:rhodanese-like domain-containing protein 6 n=1 Tax=Phalaenopsis equestris TaxID=78828 RepID=UPI0009E60799